MKNGLYGSSLLWMEKSGYAKNRKPGLITVSNRWNRVVGTIPKRVRFRNLRLGYGLILSSKGASVLYEDAQQSIRHYF